MKRIAACLVLAMWSLPAAAQDGSGARIAEEFARPVLQELVETARQTTTAIAALCQKPDDDALNAAHAAFGELVPAWGRASILRFGPLAADNRFERLFFWPDPRGIALRQVQGVLAEQDASATTVEGVAGKSVALQGLPALEFALYGSGSTVLTMTPGHFRCAYAHAVAGNMATIALEVLAGWQADTDFAQSFAAPATDREPYRSAGEVNGEIIKALSTTFQFVRAAEIQPPLGADAAKANGKRAPLWRSEQSFALVAAQVKAAQTLLDIAGYSETLPQDMRWVPASIQFELATAMRMLGAIVAAPADAFVDLDDRGRINVADLALDHAGHLVSEQLAAALGLIMGFNALDGD